MGKLITNTEKSRVKLADSETKQRFILTKGQVLNFDGCDIKKVTYEVVTENEEGKKEKKMVTTYVVVFADGFQCTLRKLTRNFVNGVVTRTEIGKIVIAPTKRVVLDQLHSLGTWVCTKVDKVGETTNYSFAPKE